MPGFKTFERKDARIGTQQFLTLDVVLEIGAVEETITVSAESPLIETSNASTGDVLDKQTLDTLPSISRMAFLASNTVPTVTYTGNPHMNRMQDQTEASRISLGGGISVGNNYLLDGYPMTDIVNRSSTVPSIEAVEEVKVQVHTYDAEMGRTGGGMFNASARSGTNRCTAGALLEPSRPPSSGQLLPADRGSRNPISILAQRRWRRRRPDHPEQDVLLVRRGSVSRRADAERQPPCADRRRARRRFLGAGRLERAGRSSSTTRSPPIR